MLKVRDIIKVNVSRDDKGNNTTLLFAYESKKQNTTLKNYSINNKIELEIKP